MRVRFWSEDGERYVTIRPEEFKDCVKKRRRKVENMPLPKASTKSTATSFHALEALGETEAKLKFMAFIEDIETTLQNSGKDAMISLKLGYKGGFQLSLKPNKTAMWYNVSATTILDCITQYLEGNFDNA